MKENLNKVDCQGSGSHQYRYLLGAAKETQGALRNTPGAVPGAGTQLVLVSLQIEIRTALGGSLRRGAVNCQPLVNKRQR